MRQVAHQTGTCLLFQLHKVTRSISTPLAWDAGPMQGYPQY